MKVGIVKIIIEQKIENVFVIKFSKNKKVYFETDFILDEPTAVKYVAKLEDNLITPGGLCSAIYLSHPDGYKVCVEIATRERDLEYTNVEEPWKLESKYIGLLKITEPKHEGSKYEYGVLITRLIYKKEMIEEFYNAIVNLVPSAKSELIESILVNGNLDSFYERIS